MNEVGFLDRFRGWVETPYSLLENDCFRVFSFRIAFFSFFIGIIWALTRDSGLLDRISWISLTLVFALTPLSFGISVVRLRISARLADSCIGYMEALRVSVLSAAANMLPLPAGAAIRVAALKTMGNSYRKCVSATLLVILVWVAVSAVCAGLILYWQGIREWGGTFLVMGSSIGLAAVFKFVSRGKTRLLLVLILTELVNIAVTGLRMMFAFHAIGIGATVPQSVVVVQSSVMGSLVGIVPSGLGIAEAAAAILAAVVGIAPEAGFLAASANRIVGWVVVASLAWVFTMRSFS